MSDESPDVKLSTRHRDGSACTCDPRCTCHPPERKENDTLAGVKAIARRGSFHLETCPVRALSARDVSQAEIPSRGTYR